MSDGYPTETVIVSKKALASDEPYDLIYSNIEFLNDQFEEHLTAEEVSADALRSYYVDYYLAQVNNGGFSQFVYNSGWDSEINGFICEGLEAMGAERHLKHFEAAAGLLDQLGPDRMDEFFESDYFGENEERDILNSFDDRFMAIEEEENLIELNARWLRQLPHLVALEPEEMQAEVERRAAALPDREKRIAAALEAAPRFEKLIRALCDEAGHELDRITAGDPAFEWKGQPLVAWHFLTDKGHFYLVDADGKARMMHGDSDEQICEIDAPEDVYGE
ncbi:hypothetical protein Mal4_09100 [Maioricimonas rarisocia]|uniref:DNA mimic protein DMP19 C-terminal domain-containing protein n=1 Tax=Maioricimonas rarisocia TaxID=2528026 RepID=A0A517Z2C5_9PLAN|nr:DUF4375 domain-containing protein [Maioricimonas rarisocia]QDU36623.1 hypothetical protein Mal4_09100 [Maioricimonas rarisocia]